MRSQKHNQGELKELKVKIESEIVDCIHLMADKSEMSIDEIVVIALKRYRSRHSDLLSEHPVTD
ncbi:MAG: hypothetical protein HOE90_00835 [Bacteriovoracaceae bacterium]|jgi:hypothetical protein|nr:hypothetical protein [Bacteriovoracaceae bacterium]